MKIKLPNHNKLYLKHLKAFEYVGKLDEINTSDKLNFISMFLDVKVEDIEEYDIEQINQLFLEITKIAITLPKVEVIKPIITVENKDYEFVGSLSKLPASWFTYLDRLSKENKLGAENIAAMCYIEKGLKYNQRNDNGEIINPISKREDFFYKNFKAVDYLPLQGFFLTKLKQYTHAFSLLKKARKRIEEREKQTLSRYGLLGITR
jgi:hypothetical protein